jgi:DNA-binding LacI/PurR family transcriptional regulator
VIEKEGYFPDTNAIRKSAVENAWMEIGLELRPELFVDGDHSIEAGMKALSALAALPDRPSAVLCSNDMTAIGVMRASFDLCLNILRDLSAVVAVPGINNLRVINTLDSSTPAASTKTRLLSLLNPPQ